MARPAKKDDSLGLFPVFSLADVIRRLHDEGHLARMNVTELRVMWAMLSYTNLKDGPDYGLAWPSVERLAEDLALKHARNVHRAIQQLQQLGYLRIIVAGGGRNNPAKRQVCVPETLARCASVSSVDKPRRSAPVKEAKHWRAKVINTGAARHPKDKEEELNTNTRCARGARKGKTAGVEGKPSFGEVKRYWLAAWKEKYIADCDFSGRCGKAINDLMGNGRGVSGACDLIDAYLADDDPWLRKQSHPLATLTTTAKINHYKTMVAPRPVVTQTMIEVLEAAGKQHQEASA